MISTIVLGRGNNRKVAPLLASRHKDVHAELRKDAARLIKDYLFGSSR